MLLDEIIEPTFPLDSNIQTVAPHFAEKRTQHNQSASWFRAPAPHIAAPEISVDKILIVFGVSYTHSCLSPSRREVFSRVYSVCQQEASQYHFEGHQRILTNGYYHLTGMCYRLRLAHNQSTRVPEISSEWIRCQRSVTRLSTYLKTASFQSAL